MCTFFQNNHSRDHYYLENWSINYRDLIGPMKYLKLWIVHPIHQLLLLLPVFSSLLLTCYFPHSASYLKTECCIWERGENKGAVEISVSLRRRCKGEENTPSLSLSFSSLFLLFWHLHLLHTYVPLFTSFLPRWIIVCPKIWLLLSPSTVLAAVLRIFRDYAWGCWW